MTRMFEQQRALWLAGLASAFMAVEWSLARGGLVRASPALPWAVAFDVLCTLPAAYAFFVLRPARRPLTELLPVCALALLCAKLMLARRHELQRPLQLWSGALELCALGLFARRCAALTQDTGGDLVWHAQRVREPLVRAIGLELCVLYYACVAPFRHPARPAHAHVVENGRAPRQLLAVLALLSVLESAGVHLLLHAYSPRIAYLVLALSLYGLAWLVALYQAFRARPLLVLPDRVLVRVSLLFSAELPRAAIERAEPCSGPAPGAARMTVGAPANLLLVLREPVAIHGPLGRVRHASRLALYVDEPAVLTRLLESSAAHGGGEA